MNPNFYRVSRSTLALLYCCSMTAMDCGLATPWCPVKMGVGIWMLVLCRLESSCVSVRFWLVLSSSSRSCTFLYPGLLAWSLIPSLKVLGHFFRILLCAGICLSWLWCGHTKLPHDVCVVHWEGSFALGSAACMREVASSISLTWLFTYEFP